MRRLGAALVPWAVLLALASATFARLIAETGGLVVDASRPSVDYANRGEPRPVGNDLTFLFLPHHLRVAKVLADFGHLPLWDDSGFGGRPMVGNPQAGLFYPPVWLVWIAGSPAALGWLTVAHLLWGGAGLYTLARGRGLRVWPATVAAGVFQANPYILAQVFEGHYPHVWSACWFPWVFWAFLECLAGRPRGLFWLPPLLAFSCLAGHPQECFLLLLVLAVWVLVEGARRAWMSSDPPRTAGRMPGRLLIALGVGLGLAAVEFVPAIYLLPWLHRATAPGMAAIPRNYSLRPLNGLQLLSPFALGGPAEYFGEDNYWESVLAIGLTPLVLLLVAIARGWRNPRSLPWLLLLTGCLWFAVGRPLGLYGLCFRWVPGMDWFRAPGRSLFLAAVGAAMLTGFGLQSLMERQTDGTVWRRLARRLAMVLSLVVLSLFLAGWAIEPSRPLNFDQMAEPARPPRDAAWQVRRAAACVLWSGPFWAAVGGLSLTVGLGCVSHSLRRRGVVIGMLGGAGLGELAWYGFRLLRVAPAAMFLAPDPPSESLLLMDRSSPRSGPLRVRARDAFFVDLQAARYGIEKTNVNDRFQLAQSAALYQVLYPVATGPTSNADKSSRTEGGDLAGRRLRQAIFDRLAVTYLVSDRVETDPGWPVVGTGRLETRPYVIQRNPTALPRAYVVPIVECAGSDPSSVFRRLASEAACESVLMDRDPLAGLPAGDRQPLTPARWRSLDPDRPVLEVTTRSPGLLVIADTWMPGWLAKDNGRDIPILRGNLCQRVIPLPRPGHHVISMRYHPPGLTLGAAVTTVAAIAWPITSWLAVLSWRRTRLKSTIPDLARLRQIM